MRQRGNYLTSDAFTHPKPQQTSLSSTPKLKPQTVDTSLAQLITMQKYLTNQINQLQGQQPTIKNTTGSSFYSHHSHHKNHPKLRSKLLDLQKKGFHAKNDLQNLKKSIRNQLQYCIEDIRWVCGQKVSSYCKAFDFDRFNIKKKLSVQQSQSANQELVIMKKRMKQLQQKCDFVIKENQELKTARHKQPTAELLAKKSSSSAIKHQDQVVKETAENNVYIQSNSHPSSDIQKQQHHQQLQKQLPIPINYLNYAANVHLSKQLKSSRDENAKILVSHEQNTIEISQKEEHHQITTIQTSSNDEYWRQESNSENKRWKSVDKEARKQYVQNLSPTPLSKPKIYKPRSMSVACFKSNSQNGPSVPKLLRKQPLQSLINNEIIKTRSPILTLEDQTDRQSVIQLKGDKSLVSSKVSFEKENHSEKKISSDNHFRTGQNRQNQQRMPLVLNSQFQTVQTPSLFQNGTFRKENMDIIKQKFGTGVQFEENRNYQRTGLEISIQGSGKKPKPRQKSQKKLKVFSVL